MLRLLWKEWIQMRLLLLALLVTPALIVIMGPGMGKTVSFLLTFVLMAAWGATAVAEEMKRGQFSVFWMPIPGWKIFLAKFLPGLGALALVPPAWVGMLAWMTRQQTHQADASKMLLAVALTNFILLINVYCFAFALSLSTNSLTGTLAGLACGIAVGILLSQSIGGSTPDLWLRSALNSLGPNLACAGAVALGAGLLFYRGLATVRRRAALWMNTIIILSLGTFTLIQFAPTLRAAASATQPSLASFPSPDGQQFAMIRSLPGKPHRLTVIELGPGKQREMLSAFYMNLIAWSPDSKSIFVQTRAHQRAETQIVKVEMSGSTNLLVSLPVMGADPWQRYGQGRVTPDGRRLVFRQVSRSSSGVDLWAIDVRTNQARVLLPYMDDSVVWDYLSDESILLDSAKPTLQEASARTLREVALDGSGIRREWSGLQRKW